MKLVESSLSPDFLSGGGEMGKLVRSMDWSQTPLGPIESWSQSLRTAVSICLASNFPICLAWGPARVQIYNDGYWPVCGDKHPQSMGQDFRACWLEAWEVIGEPFDSASSGQTSFLENQRIFLNRHGYLEETFFTFSFSPIRDERGSVGGLFHPVLELTQQSLIERRLNALRRIAEDAADAQTLERAGSLVAEALSLHDLDLPFALVYLVDHPAGNAIRLVGSAGLPPGTAVSPSSFDLTGNEAEPWPFREVLRSGQTQECAHGGELLAAYRVGPYPEAPKSSLVIPIIVPGLDHPLGILIAGVSSRRALDEQYRTFYLMLRESVTSALLTARSYEQERRRAEALAEIDRAKTVFFSNISHEFRTPLTLMLGPLEDMLAESSRFADENRERLEVVWRNSLRLLKLVNTLLDFSRIEAGRMEAHYEPTDLGMFSADLASTFRSTIERAGMKLIVNVDNTPARDTVYVDREMWEKIVLNLLSNAFKFTMKGEIEMSVRRAGKSVELTVRDTGTGIPAEEIPHLFERFHQVKGSHGRNFEGTGIGLSLVQELVKLHGGTVRVESEVNHGSRFIVSIPQGSTHLPADRIGTPRHPVHDPGRARPYVAEALRWLPAGDSADNGNRSEAVAAEDSPSQPGAGSHILIVEDNTDMREYLQRLLHREYEVTVAMDGAAALESIRERVPDLVLADVMMPRVDGIELLREVRSDERLKTLPVILLSARAGEEARIDGLEAGADDYLTKPFSAKELEARVRAALAIAKIRRDFDEDTHRRAEQFETLLNAAPLGVYLIGRDFRIREMNPTALSVFGDIPGLIGRDFHEVIHILWPKQYADEIIERFRHTLATGEPYIVHERIEQRQDRGLPEFYEWQINRIPLPDGGFGVVCYFRDISQQVHAREIIEESEARLRQKNEELTFANQELEEFSYVASHDLQEPLRMINIYTQLLVRDFSSNNPKAEKYAGLIEQGVVRMERLIRDLLTYSRAVQKDELPVGKADLTAALSEAMSVLKSRIEENAAIVTADSLPVLRGDTAQIAHVFQNLLSNALKYQKKDCVAKIHISANLNADQCVVCMHDNGIGFEQQYAERIFKLFKRLHKEEYPGTGLGLAICQRIVERYGGRMWAEGTPKEGAKFYFSLPCVADE